MASTSGLGPNIPPFNALASLRIDAKLRSPVLETYPVARAFAAYLTSPVTLLVTTHTVHTFIRSDSGPVPGLPSDAALEPGTDDLPHPARSRQAQKIPACQPCRIPPGCMSTRSIRNWVMDSVRKNSPLPSDRSATHPPGRRLPFGSQPLGVLRQIFLPLAASLSYVPNAVIRLTSVTIERLAQEAHCKGRRDKPTTRKNHSGKVPIPTVGNKWQTATPTFLRLACHPECENGKSHSSNRIDDPGCGVVNIQPEHAPNHYSEAVE